jgi:shikimate kinase
MDKPNIILIGFSTTGKSTAGRLLAERLGWAFVDTDAWIAGMAGKSVAEIFAEEGESHFRALERTALEEALLRRKTVVATGGGAVVSQQNRNLMSERGWIILLEAEPETILRRMQTEDAASDVPLRPLLAGSAPLDRIIALKNERQSIYSALADHTVHTDGQTIETVVENLVHVLTRPGFNPNQ